MIARQMVEMEVGSVGSVTTNLAALAPCMSTATEGGASLEQPPAASTELQMPAETKAVAELQKSAETAAVAELQIAAEASAEAESALAAKAGLVLTIVPAAVEIEIPLLFLSKKMFQVASQLLSVFQFFVGYLP